MAKQPEQRPQLKLNGVAQQAKNLLLHDGHHVPIVIAEGSDLTVVVHLQQMEPNFEQRLRQFFMLGKTLAHEDDLGVLHQAFLISEGWMSTAKEGKLPPMPPSQDPQRQEVLIISHVDVQQAHNEVVVFTMQRNRKGKLVSVEARSQLEPGMTADSPLLEALVAGFFGLARRDD